MGSSPKISPEFQSAFHARAGAGGVLSFAEFMDLALYDPEVGYYRGGRNRIGYGKGTDFFTASTSGSIFGELVCAACTRLLEDRDPREHTFVEIGAEPGGGVLTGVAHPFGAARTVPLGSAQDLTGACVVFSNELFDAQPCVRSVFRQGRWRQAGVRLAAERLEWVELPSDLTSAGEEGYQFDRPLAAAALASVIARQPWTGLFLAIDYGKNLRELAEETPGGTLRAYYQHTQSGALLARPGEQDLTCHVCWDWIASALQAEGFRSPVLESQEAFFIRHAGDFIAASSAAEAAHFSKKKLALLQLLHPSHLGQKFQVLHALR